MNIRKKKYKKILTLLFGMGSYLAIDGGQVQAAPITTTVTTSAPLVNGAEIVVNGIKGISATGGNVLTGGDQISVIQANSAQGVPAISANGGSIHLGSDAHIVATGTGSSPLALDVIGANQQITLGDRATIEVSGGKDPGTPFGAAVIYADTDTSVHIGNDANFLVNGDGAIGINSFFAKEITIGDRLVFRVNGDNTNNVRVSGDTHFTVGDYALIESTGTGSVALVSGGQSVTSIGANSQITAKGTGTTAVLINTASQFSIGSNSFIQGQRYGMGFYGTATGQTIHLTDTSVKADEYGIAGIGIVFSVSGGQTHLILSGEKSVVEGGLGSFYSTTGEIDVTMSNQASAIGDLVLDTNGILKIDADQSRILGHARDESINSGVELSLDLKNNSYWQGLSLTDKTNLSLDGTSQWDMLGKSIVNRLDSNGGLVNYQNGGVFSKLTVADLGGSGGIFAMSTDVGNQKGDLLGITNSSSGSHQLLISNPNQYAKQTDVLQVVDSSAAGIRNASFSLARPVDIGAYRFGLRTPDLGATYELYATGISDAGRVVPNASRAAYMLNYAEMSTLIQRMGDLRQNNDRGNVWGRVFGGQYNVDGAGPFDRFKQSYTGVQAGMDKKFSSSNSKGDFYVGGLFGYTRASNDYLTVGDGQIDSYYGGVYGTYFRPDNGFYVDSVLKVGTMKNEMNLNPAGSGWQKDKDSATAWSFSVESGRRFFLNDPEKKRQGFYLELQAQVVFGQTGELNYRFNNSDVALDSVNSTQGRLGVLAGYEVKSGKNPINVYGKVSWVKEFNGDVNARVAGTDLGASMSDNWWIWGVGVTANIKNKHNLYLDIEQANGGGFKQDWQINGGYRFHW